MRKTVLRIQGGTLLGVVALILTFGLNACASAQAGRDFSNITGASNIPVAGAAQEADHDAKQKAAEAAANAALATPAPEGRASLAPNQLGPGDKVKVTVFGEEDLSGEFDIDNTGSLNMPLVGEVPVRGLTPRDLEKKLTGILEGGYLKNPRVNIEVMNYRPFFILGEVNKPGSYPSANEMTVINAVALGGGYTTRAKTGQVKIRRASSPDKEEWIGEDGVVYPGDVLRVEERFF